MNTHIIIPIVELSKIYKGKKDPTYDEVLVEALEIFKLLNRSKRISLDEKDIEEKANEYAGDGNWELFEDDDFIKRKESYKEALKSLL